jgi:hypothetical protein
MSMYSRRRVDFRRDKVYRDFLSADEAPGERLIVAPTSRWLAAAGAFALYAALLALLYWASDVEFARSADPAGVPAWRHALGVALNTSAVGFGAMFAVSLAMWAGGATRARYPTAFGALGMTAAALIALLL